MNKIDKIIRIIWELYARDESDEYGYNVIVRTLEQLRPYVELGELVAYNTIWDIEYGLAKTHEVAFKIQQLMDKILGGESVERNPNDSRGANIRRNENKLSTYSTLQQIKEM